MNLRDYALGTATDSELKSFALVFTLIEFLKDKGVMSESDEELISTIAAQVSAKLINEKKKDWEK